MRPPWLPLFLACGLLCLLSGKVTAQQYGDLPLSFEPNLGQAAPNVSFVAHGKGYGFYLSGTSAVLRLGTSAALTLEVSEGQAPSNIVAEQALPGKANYFQGQDPSKWVRAIPTYTRVRMCNVYPGVDLVYYGNHRQLEYDLVVHPGGDPSAIGLTVRGADSLTVTKAGELTMKVGGSEVHWHAPIAYQEIGGQRRAVESHYELADSTLRFAVGAYDRTRELVIDPALVYSTYLGGNGGGDGDVGNAIAADAAGNAYVVGMAASADFPTTASAYQPAPQGNDDAFVTKINAAGTALVYSTYLGGGGEDVANAIAIDSAGEAYVTGQTGSGLHGTTAFPTTAGAYQREPNPATLNNNVFVAKLSADGSDLIYSTYLSGTNDSSATGIAIDGSGNAYVLTNTGGGFPVTSDAYQKTAGTDGCPYEQFADGQAQAVTKLDASASALTYSTYVGHGCDYGSGIAVNGAGEAYITGHTQDAKYPVTSGAAQGKFGGVVDGFVTRLNASGSGLLYSTFLGGPLADFANSIALDGKGYAYVTGNTDGDFPTTSGVYEPTAGNNGYSKGFITKVSPLGKALVYSTYIKGASNVSFNSIAVDKSYNAYVTGYTDGTGYPVTSTADQTTCDQGPSGCLTQAVVTKINATATSLLYSSYFGASDANNNYFPGNIANGIAIDGSDGFYITGRTGGGLKTTASAEQPNYPATSDSSSAFVAKFNTSGTNATDTSVSIDSPKSGTTMQSPVKISATAAGGNVNIMQIYVDGVRRAQASGDAISASLAMATGRHRVTAQAINKNGSVAKTTVYVTVK